MLICRIALIWLHYRYMKKFFLTLAGLTLLVFNIAPAFAKAILFVEEGCPYCAVVHKYMEENNLMKELDVQVYDVTESTDNQRFYRLKADEFGYTESRTPLFIHDGQYFVGDQNIIAYLKTIQPTQLNTPTQGTLSDDDADDLEDIIDELDDSPNMTTLKYFLAALALLLAGGLIYSYVKRSR